jgi:uncharacterized SAM-binding protein YcdF (DUF218 family)
VALAAGSAFLLYLASTPLVAQWAAWTLEREVPAVAVERLPVADAIVVLGGAMYATQREDGSVHLYARGSGDRFETGLAAIRVGKATLIVFGGGAAGVEGVPTEGEWNRRRAVERGVPDSAALAAGRALYTSDEAQLVTERLRERDAGRMIVRTTAINLPRAAGHYRGLGLEVIPLPSDFATRGTAETWSIKLLVPRGIALAQTDSAVLEWLGILAGLVR